MVSFLLSFERSRCANSEAVLHTSLAVCESFVEVRTERYHMNNYLSLRRRVWASLATTLLMAVSLQAQDPNEGLVALWNFDNSDFQDSIGEFHGEGNGTDPIEFTASRPGFGQALLLDGVDQFVEIVGGEPDDLAFEGGSMSLSVWFKIGTFDKNWQALVAKGEGSNWRTHRRGGEAGMAHAGGIGEGPAGDAVSVDEWHHLVAVTDAELTDFGTALYIDGELYSSNAGQPNLTANSQRVMIGENPDARNRYWSGEIDDVALYNRVLSPEEVVAIFTGDPLGAPPIDADGDGMSDSWERLYGLDPTDPSDANEDPDGDGDTNLTEFQNRTDPTDTTAPELVAVDVDCDLTTITLDFSELLDESTASDPANYQFDSGLEVLTASVQRKTVTLITGEQEPGSTHNLSITGVQDLSKNDVAADTGAELFSCSETSEGVLHFEAWFDIPGAAIDGLFDVRVPEPGKDNGDTPSFVGAVFSLDSEDAFPSGPNDNYAARMFGFITPPETGDYNFFIRSDDASELFISTDDDPANVVWQAEELDCCNPFQEPGIDDTVTINPIPMVAGERYYIEARYKEGGGGDWMEVAWRLDGDNTPAPNLRPIPGEFLSTDTPLLVPGATAVINGVDPNAGVEPEIPLEDLELTDGLVALWNFDDGTFDDSLGEFHGTPNGSFDIEFVTSRADLGQAILLDGVDQFVEITGGQPDDLAFQGGSMALSAWFRPDDFDKNWQAIIAKGEGTNWRVHRRSGESGVAFAGGNGDTPAGTDVTLGEWHHLVAMTDANNNEFASILYIDGVVYSSNGTDANLGANGQRVMFGENPDANGRFFTGALDEIAIWNRILRPDEVATLASGAPLSLPTDGGTVTPPLPPIPDTGNPGDISGIERTSDTTATIEYTGTLQSADTVSGPYSDVAGATSPFTVNLENAPKFYRAR